MPTFDIGVAELFQSTLSMRRATSIVNVHIHVHTDFNPRSP